MLLKFLHLSKKKKKKNLGGGGGGGPCGLADSCRDILCGVFNLFISLGPIRMPSAVCVCGWVGGGVGGPVNL